MAAEKMCGFLSPIRHIVSLTYQRTIGLKFGENMWMDVMTKTLDKAYQNFSLYGHIPLQTLFWGNFWYLPVDGLYVTLFIPRKSGH